ncbi:MAG TPA: hypothetical protein VIA06_13580 [Candidatus Dormibacteraeota bacterium]|jgi:hypothetical protein|nr:hypothetical protein [Candidatus Dormibacteraeota bacterium]
MDPYAIDMARRRHAERIEQAQEERLALAVAHATPNAWGRLVLRLADLLLNAGESLRSRYRSSVVPGGESSGWA